MKIRVAKRGQVIPIKDSEEVKKARKSVKKLRKLYDNEIGINEL